MDLMETGARGNGITDDTLAIQDALDTYSDITCSNPHAVFLVSSKLVMRDEQTFDLGGARIKAANGSNCTVIGNDSPEGYSTGITLQNGTIDGNVINQKISGFDNNDQSAPTVHFHNIHGLDIDIEIINFRCAGLRVHASSRYQSMHNRIRNIRVRNGLGAGVTLYGEGFEIGTIDVSGTDHMENDQWGYHPNAMTVNAENSSIEKIIQRNCAWGSKIQDGSKNVSVGSIEASGTWDGHAIKIQGSADKRNEGIKVGRITSTNNNRNGLYIYESIVDIEEYHGKNNGLAFQALDSGSYPDAQYSRDVWVRSSGGSIGELRSENALGVLQVRESEDLFTVDEIYVTEPSNNAQIVKVQSSVNNIGQVVIHKSEPYTSTVIYHDGQDGKVTTVGSIISTQALDGNGQAGKVYYPGDEIVLTIDAVNTAERAPYRVEDNTTIECEKHGE